MNSEDTTSHEQPQIGRTLERARTERGLSLWQVEEATKIRAKYLRDLERENFDVLPAVYVLGSLKTYADFLGLDGEALALELKNRQSPPQEDPPGEEAEAAPQQAERGGLLGSLVALLGFGGRRAEDEGGANVPTSGRGPRLYWGLGGALILVLLVSLASTLGGGNRPAVPQVREPAVSEAPSRLASSTEIKGGVDGERNAKKEAEDRPEGGAKPPREAEKSDDEKDETDRADKNEQDGDAEAGQETDSVAFTAPESPTASASSASSASASASASTAASASAPYSAAASASATPAASAPASATAPAPAPTPAPAAAPRNANPGVGPAGGQPAPTAGAPAGPPRREAGTAGPPQRIVGKVTVVESIVRYVR